MNHRFLPALTGFILTFALCATPQTIPSANGAAGSDAATVPIPMPIKTALKHYMEDMTERRLIMAVIITELDVSGNITKTHHYKRWSEVTALQKREGGLAPSMRTRVDRHLRYFEMTHDAATLPIAELMTATSVPASYALDILESGGETRIHFASRDSCTAWRDTGRGLEFALCGEGELTADAATGQPHNARFTASGGLPAAFDKGKHTLRAWAFEQTFQSVPLPGGPDVTLPHTVKSVFQTERGQVIVESTYALAPEKK